MKKFLYISLFVFLLQIIQFAIIPPIALANKRPDFPFMDNLMIYSSLSPTNEVIVFERASPTSKIVHKVINDSINVEGLKIVKDKKGDHWLQVKIIAINEGENYKKLDKPIIGWVLARYVEEEPGC